MQQLALAILSGIMRKPARERCGSASGRALYRLISVYPGVISATYLRVGCTHRFDDFTPTPGQLEPHARTGIPAATRKYTSIKAMELAQQTSYRPL